MANSETDARRGEGKAREEALWNEARERFPMHQDYTNDQNKACLEEQREWVAAQQSATPQPAQGERRRCPHDEGYCHHGCAEGECFRKSQGMYLTGHEPPAQGEREEWRVGYLTDRDSINPGRCNLVAVKAYELAWNRARQSSAAEIERKDELYESATGLIEAYTRENAELRDKIERLTTELAGPPWDRAEQAEAQRDRARGQLERICESVVACNADWESTHGTATQSDMLRDLGDNLPESYREKFDRAALPDADEGVG